ncbi:MAG: helix-turn-helix domain-containing protein [Calditrichia bacterium]
MKEFFQNFKEIREAKGITLEEIAERSRLPLKFLKAIEDGDLESLPQGYDRIYFRRYLKEIGEDKPDVWQDFQLFFGQGPEEGGPRRFESEPIKAREVIGEEDARQAGPGEAPEPRPGFFQELSLRLNMDKIYRYFWIAVTLIILGVVGYFSYQQFIFVKDNQVEVREVTVSDYIEEMQARDSLATPTLKKSGMVPGSAGSVSVTLKAVERTWIREVRDETDTTDYILRPGLTHSVKAANNLQFVFGRADGVMVWANGDSLGLMGGPDQIVIKLVINQNGIVEKRLRKSAKKSPPPADTTRRAVSGTDSSRAD